MAVGGSSYSASNTEMDQSAQTSGNMTGNSADRVSQQFNNLGSGTSALDFNNYLSNANSGFYNSIAGEQLLESGVMGKGGVLKYAALGVAAVAILVVVIKGRKS